MPEVTAPPGKPESPETAPPPETPPPPSAQALGKDSRGVLFDPKKFRPEKDILGRWKTIGGGRRKDPAVSAKPESRKPAGNAAPPTPPPDQPASGSVIPPDDATPPPPVTAGEDRFAIAAETYLLAGYSLLDGAFAGKGEWMPDDQAEHLAMKQQLAHWLRSRNSEDLPPGAAFAVLALGYGAKRIQRPNTNTRWRLWWLSLRAWWGNRRAQVKLDALATPAP